MPSVITSRAIARPASKLLLASPLQTISRSVTIPISRSSSPIGMQPMSCPCINFASSVTGVLGLTQSTPLCITSLTFMADLRYWVSGALAAMQRSPPFFPTIQPIGRDGTSARYHSCATGPDKCRRCRCHPPEHLTARPGFPPNLRKGNAPRASDAKRRPSMSGFTKACVRRNARGHCVPRPLVAADTTGISSVVRAKTPMRCVGRQARKLRVTEMKQCLVITGFHIDLRLCLDAIVDDEIQAVAFANGRNCTVRAVAEQLIDLGFIGHVDIVTEFCPQFR